MSEQMDVLQHVEACIKKLRTCNVAEGELEIRLGTFVNGQFCAGVPQAVFEQLERDMEETSLLSAESRYRELVDYHYVARRGETIRTRVEFDTDRMEVSRHHIVKCGTDDVVISRYGDEDSSDACRVAFSHEKPLNDPPTTCIPTHVRVKQRRRFTDLRKGSVVWSYELSKTWSASSRLAVEHMQKMSDPVYEVECELVDACRSYMDEHTDGGIAKSILLKAALLMGDDTTNDMHVLKSKISPNAF